MPYVGREIFWSIVRLSEINIETYDTLLLDRDGTINVHLVGDYVKHWEEFEFIPGVLEAMPKIAQHFKHIFIVTNQRGVGKGIMTEADLTDIHKHMMEEIEKAGGRIDGIYYCTSLTDEDVRRKPGRGMWDDIQRDYPDVTAERTIMVGDGDIDKEFASNCGIAFCRVDSLKKKKGRYEWIKTKDMDVVVLAGGLGTRLRSVVSEVPKCMAPVNGKPFLHYLLTALSQYRISKVVLSVGYKRECIMDWVQVHGNEFPFEIDFAVEETPLGTGGGIRLAMEKCTSDSVCIMNGDTFFDVDLERLKEAHKHSGKLLTMAVKHLKDFDRYGTVSFDKNGVVTGFNEKRYCEDGYINGGVYMVSDRNLLKAMPEKFSFETEFLQPKAAAGLVNSFVSDGYFIDIGIPEDYAKANEDFKDFEVWTKRK